MKARRKEIKKDIKAKKLKQKNSMPKRKKDN
jgi:hypothetical protein